MPSKTITVKKTKLLRDVRRDYFKALLAGDAKVARTQIQNGLQGGLGTTDLYLDVLMPAQEQIGTLWEQNQIQISEEHLATEITLQQMNFLRERFEPRASLGLRAVVTRLVGDPHIVGARVVADFLHQDGWEVDFLGHESPVEDLIEFVRKRRVALIAISVTLLSVIPSLEAIIAKLKQFPEPPKLLVGGRVFIEQPQLHQQLGADGTAIDAFRAMHEARRVCGVAEVPLTLPQLLRGIGSSLSRFRRQRGISQSDLATAAGLDRAYISSVEHGKQNITVGALLRLSAALEVAFETLILDAIKQERLAVPDSEARLDVLSSVSS